MGHIVFLSDFHLGIPDRQSSIDREKKICRCIESVQDGLSELFLVGDVFDFWFEYSTVVPKGHYRLMGKLAELSDKGVKIHYLVGNHDMWQKDLFVKEMNIQLYYEPIVIHREGLAIFIGHGDGLGPGDSKYKMLKKIFRSSICQFLFKWIHPDIGMRIAHLFSYKSRYSQNPIEEQYMGNDTEWLYQFCTEYQAAHSVDYMIFGHRHLPIYTRVGASSVTYINLGDWLNFNTYAILHQGEIKLLQNESNKTNMDFNPTI